MEQNVNGGITTSVNMSIRKFMCVKKIMFGILIHVILKMESI